MRDRTIRRVASLAAIGYVGVVATVELARSTGHGPRVVDVASSPAGVISGHVERLLTSGLVVAGDPVVQLAGLGLAIMAVLVLLGPWAFWCAALAGHVAATLVAYAGVGALWLVSRADVDTVVDAPDYGVSCVWAGTLGVLMMAGLRSPRTRLVLVCALAAAAAFLAAIPFSSDLAGVEHVLAFALGAAAGTRVRLRSGAVAQPVPA